MKIEFYHTNVDTAVMQELDTLSTPYDLLEDGIIIHFPSHVLIWSDEDVESQPSTWMYKTSANSTFVYDVLHQTLKFKRGVTH